MALILAGAMGRENDTPRLALDTGCYYSPAHAQPTPTRHTGERVKVSTCKVNVQGCHLHSPIPRAVWIDVDDLPNVNTHHFSADSQLVIGQRFAKGSNLPTNATSIS